MCGAYKANTLNVMRATQMQRARTTKAPWRTNYATGNYIWLGSVYLTDSHKPFIFASVVHIYIGIFKDSSILRQVYSLLCFYKISVPRYSSRK